MCSRSVESCSRSVESCCGAGTAAESRDRCFLFSAAVLETEDNQTRALVDGTELKLQIFYFHIWSAPAGLHIRGG